MKNRAKKEASESLQIHEMPDDVKHASKEIQSIWLNWKKADDENRNHPERYQAITNKQTGEAIMLDMLGFSNTIKKICEKNGVSKKEIERILEVQSRFYTLKQNKANLAKELKKALYGSIRKENKTPLDIERAKIIDLFGKFHTTEEVYQICNHQMGICVSLTDVRKFQQEHDIIISQKKAEYILKRQDFRLATETGRLEELSDLYYTIKQKFELSGGNINYSKELRSLIDSIRKEVKGDEIKLTVDGKIDINATIQANKNIMDIVTKLPVHMIIVGMVAAKQNINPTQVMGSLATSYYSMMNGFNGMVDETPKEIIHPSTIIKSYDWSEIERIADNEEQEEAIKPFLPTTIYEDIDLKDKAEQRKKSLLDTIKRFEQIQHEKRVKEQKEQSI